MALTTFIRSDQDLRPMAGANPRPGEPEIPPGSPPEEPPPNEPPGIPPDQPQEVPGEPQPVEVPPGMPVEVPPVPPPELLGVRHCVISYFCHYYIGGSDWIYGPVVMNGKRRAESGKV